MLPKKNRIQKNIEFQKIFKNSVQVHEKNFSIRVFQRKSTALPVRFGFIVSNKIEKRATRRNALKRQFRKVAEDLISCMKSGYDVAVIVKANFKYPYDQEEIRKQFTEIIKKAKLYNEKESD